MLLVLIITLSISNIALAFYMTRLFRRDRFQAILEEYNSQQNASAEESSNETPQPSEQTSAEQHFEKEQVPEGEPTEPTPLEVLYGLTVGLVAHLAEMDHRTLTDDDDADADADAASDQVDPQQELPAAWQQLSQLCDPIELQLQSLAESENASLETLAAAGRTLLEQSREQAATFSSTSEELDRTREMVHLRDVFNAACAFRNECEDLLVDETQVQTATHRPRSQGALRQKAAKLLAAEDTSAHCVIRLELEQIRELNSLYGAASVNALLNELHERLTAQLTENLLVARYHGQYFLALVPGELEAVAALGQVVVEQITSEGFTFVGHEIEFLLQATLVPLEPAEPTDADLLARLASPEAQSISSGSMSSAH